MPGFGLFPKRQYAEVKTSSPTSSTASSPSRYSSFLSFATISEERNGIGYLPPVRVGSPISFNKPTMHDYSGSEYSCSTGFHDSAGLGDMKYTKRDTLMKPLPEIPACSIFDRLQMPDSFHPTRRAPLPPSMQSWIDLSDDEDDDRDIDHVISSYRARLPDTPTSTTSPMDQRIEKEIMRMLQFNEERDITRRIALKREDNRKSSLKFGGLIGKLKRTMSVRQGSNDWADSRRTGYFS